MTKLKLLSLLALIGVGLGQYLIWYYAPLEETMGVVQKIFYMHLPMAWWGLISFFTVFVCSVGYLFKRSQLLDTIALGAAELGVLMSGLALISGSIWGRMAWNVWWTWDPKLTTTLIMWFVYAGYLVLRTSPIGREKRSLVCAVLGIVAFLDVPLVFYAARVWRSVHPNVFGSKGGGMEPEMLTTLFVNLAAFGLVWLALLAFRVREEQKRQELEAGLRWSE
ncbi:MAG: cytochrome c biogenesis protein CcsA [Desulfovibrio sp.]